MIKAILFDFDGVLTIDKTGSTSILNYLASHSGINIKTLKDHYYKYNDGLLYGEYTHRDIWDNFCKDIGVKLDFSLMHESFIHTPLDNDMISLVKELKKSYKIGMVTDNKKDRIDDIMDYFNLLSYFDVVSISAEYKSGKDEKDIFKGTIEKLNVDYDECVFIDNSKKNLIIPQKCGMKTILFNDEVRSIESFRQELFKLIR